MHAFLFARNFQILSDINLANKLNACKLPYVRNSRTQAKNLNEKYFYHTGQCRQWRILQGILAGCDVRKYRHGIQCDRNCRILQRHPIYSKIYDPDHVVQDGTKQKSSHSFWSNSCLNFPNVICYIFIQKENNFGNKKYVELTERCTYKVMKFDANFECDCCSHTTKDCSVSFIRFFSPCIQLSSLSTCMYICTNSMPFC